MLRSDRVRPPNPVPLKFRQRSPGLPLELLLVGAVLFAAAPAHARAPRRGANVKHVGQTNKPAPTLDEEKTTAVATPEGVVPPPPVVVIPRVEPRQKPSTEVAVQAPASEPAAEASKGIGLDVALKAALLIPAGNTANAAAARDAEAVASKAAFGSAALAFRYSPPFLGRSLSFAIEGAWYQLAGDGTRSFANDPDFGPTLSYQWKLQVIPIFAGLAYRLPLGLPVSLSPTAGFTAAHVTSVSSYQSPGTDARVSDAPQRAWAMGFYAGAEAALKLGPGSLLLEFRYVNARTDLDFARIYAGAFNKAPGDIEGANLLLGYRYAF